MRLDFSSNSSELRQGGPGNFGGEREVNKGCLWLIWAWLVHYWRESRLERVFPDVRKQNALGGLTLHDLVLTLSECADNNERFHVRYP